MAGTDKYHGRAGRMAETNNHSQGRTGAKVKLLRGPAAGGSTAGNPTKDGKIKMSKG